jgi:ribosomal protein L37AE/L43A
MSSFSSDQISAPAATQIQCSKCERSLPLRLTLPGEDAALWHCTQCKTPYVAFGVEAVF